ncbi:MAG TPA: proteasome subunit alpha [Mycobacteriales bacterium]|nr:proteasome subunit alpha [Mycobacteriales bacterium]
MSMPFYVSAEQLMRDRSEYARKGLARGRGVVALKFVDGVLFVAETPLSTLRKVGEIYDRIGFAAAGRYNEYESLRVAGVRFAELHGYSYSRRDVSARGVAKAYAQTLGAIFTEQQKPYEVEICVAEVGDAPERDELYRISYDGSIATEAEFMVMGGQAEAITGALRERYEAGMSLADAVQAAVAALGQAGGDAPRELGSAQLEVALLDRNRAKRAFRRLSGDELERVMPDSGAAAPEDDSSETDES